MIKKEFFTLSGAKGRAMLTDLTYDDTLRNAPLIIFAHGFKGFKDWGTHNLVAQYFAESGYRFLKFNFSHNGTTPDKPTDFADLIAFSDNTFSMELDDLKTVIDFACNGTAIPRANGVYLIGHSMGGGISIIKTAEDKRIKKLVTMASVSGFRNLWPKQAEEQWRLQGIMYMLNSRTNQQMPLKSTLLDDLDKHPARLDVLTQAGALTQPWLIIHGDEDKTVPLSHARQLKKAQPQAELLVIKGADHTFGATHPYAKQALPKGLAEFCDLAINFLINKFIAIYTEGKISFLNRNGLPHLHIHLHHLHYTMGISGSKKEGRKFLNPIPTDEAGFSKLIPIMRAYATNKAEVMPKKTLGPFKTDASIYQAPPKNGLRITWVGHSSLLIEIDGCTILTDPVWSQRVSFVQWMGPKRFFDAPIALSDLPPLDAIILSHDHYDHLDKDTIKFFAGTTIPFFCSLGVGQHLQKWGIVKNFITELDWGDSVMIDHDCVVTATPSRHFSGRGILGRNETLWSSFVIKGTKHTIFFGADSGWFPGFEAIGEAFGPFDLTMLEIGAYGEYWPDIHMGPDKASNAHLALKGKLMMPIHWGTFNLALHDWFEPIEKLQQFAAQKKIELFVPKPGVPTEVKGPYNSEWWV